MRKMMLCFAVMAVATPVFFSRLLADSPDRVFNPVVKIKGAGSKYLQKIEILNPDGRAYDSETLLYYAADGSIQMDLGLGESISKVIILKPASPAFKDFKIEQQYETSLTLMDEGPHMDLKDWKHYVSIWELLAQNDNLSFTTKDVESDQFPKVKKREIVAAAIAESIKWKAKGYDEGDRWIAVARRCEGAKTYPCGVSVSKIRLRISVKEGGKWKPVQIIELNLPMGC